MNNTDKMLRENPNLIDEMYKKYGKHFCAAPWTSVYTGEEGIVTTCCKSRTPLGYTSKNTLEEISNSEKAKEVRREFLEGKKPEQCGACWQAEEAGGIANNRQFSNWMGASVIDDAIAHTDETGYMDKHFPTWLDLLWTNKCNFACIGCKPSLSSTIAKNFTKELSILHDIDYEKDINWSTNNSEKIDFVVKHSDHIEKIHLNGGEPLMSEDIFEFLEAMINKGLHKSIHIWSHTNGSVKKYKGNNILDYFARWGKKCKITLSHDGHGPIGEYIRYGYKDSKWLDTYNNIEERGIDFSVQTCINVFNVLYLKEIENWYAEHLPPNTWSNLTMWYDKSINVRMLNHVPHLKKQAVDILDNLKGNNCMRGWDKLLTDHKEWLLKDDSIKDWNLVCLYRGVNALDITRNTNFQQTFPKLQELYNLGEELDEFERTKPIPR
jgi:organic radical activating enzyme